MTCIPRPIQSCSSLSSTTQWSQPGEYCPRNEPISPEQFKDMLLFPWFSFHLWRWLQCQVLLVGVWGCLDRERTTPQGEGGFLPCTFPSSHLTTPTYVSWYPCPDLSFHQPLQHKTLMAGQRNHLHHSHDPTWWLFIMNIYLATYSSYSN